MKGLTIKELKDIIKDLSDDTPVVIADSIKNRYLPIFNIDTKDTFSIDSGYSCFLSEYYEESELLNEKQTKCLVLGD